MRHAAALAGPEELEWAPAVDGLGEISGARRHNGAAELFFDAIAKESFLASERTRRLKLAIGKMLETFGAAGYADVFLDEVVVGLDVFVTERLVFTVAVKGSCLEIPIAEAQADAAPDVGAAASDAQAAHPVEWLFGGRCVRLIEVVDKPVVRIFVANPEFDLDGARLTDDFRRAVTVLEFELRLVLGKILVGLRAAGFEESDLQARFREALAGPAAGSAGSDNDDIKRTVLVLRHRMKIRSGY